MNTEKPVKKDQKEFDAVVFMRERRTKIASETEGMNVSDLKKYFGQRLVFKRSAGQTGDISPNLDA